MSYRSRGLKVKLRAGEVRIQGFEVDPFIDALALKLSKGISANIAPHLVAAAEQRAPKGVEQNFNPQTKSFQSLKLRDENEFPGRTNEAVEARSRLRRLHGETASGRAAIVSASDIKFFVGTGPNKGRTPDAIQPIAGTVKGAFAHKAGTLKDSIRFDGVRRVGDRVIGTVRAHVPYAHRIHEGWTYTSPHSGGGGKSKEIAPQPFLKQGLLNIRDRLKNPSTYEG